MAKARMQIRLVTEKDLGALAKLYARAYVPYRKWEQWSEPAALRLLKYWLKRQADLFFVAEQDKRVVGAFVAGIKPWWDGNHLVDGELVVDPNHQQKGIGSRLLRAVFEKAINKYDVTVWEAVTFKKTRFPLNWYRKLGLHEIKEWTLIGGSVKEALRRL